MIMGDTVEGGRDGRELMTREAGGKRSDEEQTNKKTE
jgi:hypothetical protein